MAAYIERENYCNNICLCNPKKCDKKSCSIYLAPVASVTAVVRCVNCQYAYWEEESENISAFKCGNHNGLYGEVDFKDFCSYGKSKNVCEVQKND